MVHEIYMQRALELARRGWGTTNPNPLVGAVIVKNGEIIGEGYHKKPGEPHAEINALAQAGEKSEGSTLYVNLEPCSHFGRTAPCTDTLIKAGIKEVVIAMQDPNPEVSGKGIKKLKQAGIKVIEGILEEEAKKLNEIFIKYITSKMPFVVWKCAMTLDGKVATASGDSRWITNEVSREYTHWWRYRVSSIMAGIGTVLADNPNLTVRLPNINVEKQPIRVIVDSFGKTPLNFNVLDTNLSPTIIVASENISKSKVELFKSKGAEVIITKSKDRVNLPELMTELHNREIDSLLVEGGPTLAASFLEDNLVDKVMIFIAPKIVGGRKAPSAVGGKGVDKLVNAWNLKNISIKRLGEDILIEGYFI